MAIGSARASPRIFERRELLPDAPTQPLVWEYVPIRENKCISAPAPGPLAPPVFGGAAMGVRARRGGGDDAAGAALGAAAVAAVAADSQAARDAEIDLEARRQSRRASSRRCDPDHRWRHVRGAGASVAGPRSHHAGASARHRRAGIEGGLSAGIADGRGRDAARCAHLLGEGEVTIFNIGPDKYDGRVVADVATRRTGNVSTAMLAAGHARSYGGGHRSGWCANAGQPSAK